MGVKTSKTIADRYQILRPLGKGAEGITYLARDLKDKSHPVALKLANPRPQLPLSEGSFNNECAVLRKLHHPNLAKVLDYGRENDSFFLVSEYVEGSDLVAEAKRRDWNAVFTLMVQAAWAMHYLEEHRVLHRDIKPANILVGKVVEKNSEDRQDRLQLKLIDFGVAAEQGITAKPAAGTLAYMAPEVLRGEKVDARSDLYSLGVVFYEMALGKLPFQQSQDFSHFLKRLAEEEIDLKPLREGGTPPGVIEIIARMVSKDPKRRMADAREIIRLINQWEQENFPESPAKLDRGFQRNIFAVPSSKEKSSVKSGGPSLPPDKVLRELQNLSRSGMKTEAWNFAEPHLQELSAWKDSQTVEDFLATVIHLLVEQGNMQEAERYLPQLREHPAFHGRPALEYFLSGIYLFLRQGRRTEAKSLYDDIPPALLKIAAPAKLARYENYAGLLFQAEKKYLEAAQHFEKAAQHAQKAERKDQEASFTANAAGLYLEQNQWTASFALFQQARKLAEEIDNPSLAASILNNLGNLYLYFGRWSEAEQALLGSLELARGQDLKPLMAYNLYLLTVTEEGRGNTERVADYLGQILALAEAWGDALVLFQALLARGYFELAQKKFPAAQQTTEELVSRAQGHSQESFLLQAKWLAAKIALAQGQADIPGILEGLEKMREDAMRRRSQNTLWQVHSDLGAFLLLKKDPNSAKRHFQEAKLILEELERQVPPEFRDSFNRDRKKEPLMAALRDLEVPMIPDSPTAKPAVPALDPLVRGKISFENWTGLNRRLLLQQHVVPLLEEILDAAIRLTGAERGFVLLAEAGPLAIRAARNIRPESLDEEEMRFSASVAQEVLRQGRSQVIFDAQSDDRFSAAESVTELKLRSLLCVPLKVGERSLGLVYLDNRFRQGVFVAEHLPLMEALADQAALSLEHTRLHEENLRSIEELKKSKDLIEKLNARLEKDLEETTHHLHAVEEGLRRQNQELALKYTYDKIIGRSAGIGSILKSLDRIVESDINVFIYGESGTGKELIAQAIHFHSARKDKPFVTENCAALPETLLESELFGHVRGAFTGAERNKIGLFEMAHGGTLFLDEVGDMSTALQAKLLRVLQEGMLRPVGSNDYRKVDVRVISASNKDLLELVKQKKFRQDLYYRLNVMRLNLPPLRERREDIPPLVDHFLQKNFQDSGRKIPKLSPEAFKILFNYDWPGNIRELQNEISRVCALITGNKIGPELLSPHLQEKIAAALGSFLEKGLDPQVEELEKRAILQAMGMVGGNKVKAAKMLRISRRTLYLKMGAFKIDPRYGKKAAPLPPTGKNK